MRSPGHERKTFVPAAGHDWLLPLYDPLLRLLGEEAIKRRLIDQAELRPGHRILDIGCGTGTLAVLVKRLHPGTEVVGLDPDPRALARARRKSEGEGLTVRFDRGSSSALPYPPSSFDRVFSSLMFHHLDPADRSATAREVRRVLKPGGSLHLLDFGPPRGRLGAALGWVFHRGESMKDNLEGRVPDYLHEAGLERAGEVAHRDTLIGTLCYYRGSRSSEPRAERG